MSLLFKLWILFLFVVIYIGIYAYKYRNPFKLIMVFGKKGSGKSTLISKLVYRQLKLNMRSRYPRYIYSSIPLDYEAMFFELAKPWYFRKVYNINEFFREKSWYDIYDTVDEFLIRFEKHREDKIQQAFKSVQVFDPKDIGKHTFHPDSLVLIDEVGMIWDNRDFKNFSTLVRDWFKLQRHYHCEVYLFSQTFDIDLKLRNLTDYMYMVNNYANVISVAHRVQRKLVVVEPTADSEGRIADGYELTPLIWQILGMRIVYITWIPFWSKFFNSFDTPELPLIPSVDSMDFFSTIMK